MKKRKPCNLKIIQEEKSRNSVELYSQSKYVSEEEQRIKSVIVKNYGE